MMNRRQLITGLVSLAAAPAIVRVSSIMPIKPDLVPGPNLITLGITPPDFLLIYEEMARAYNLPVRLLLGHPVHSSDGDIKFSVEMMTVGYGR